MTLLTTAQLDRACGVLLATAAGDALGAGYEFGPPLPPGAPVEMTGGGQFDWAPGEWTDDTSMAVAVAETAAAGGGDLRTAGAQDTVTARWRAWAAGAKDIGAQTSRVLAAARGGTAGEALAAARDLHERTGLTAGNGSLMRTAPVALAYLGDPGGLTQAAAAVSALTHYDAEAGEACVLWCHAIRHAVLTGELDARAGLGHLPAPSRGRWAGRLAEAEHARTADFTRNGWVVEALQAAWCAVAATPVPADDPASGQFRAGHLRLALEEAVRGGRDADTVAAIAGGLLGAAYGASAVPAGWRLRLHGWPGLRSAGLIALAAAAAGAPSAGPAYGGGDRPVVTVAHPDDPGLLLADVAALRDLPAAVTAVVSLCPAGERERAAVLARVPPQHWLEVRLADDDPARNPNLDFVLHDTVTAVEELRAAGHVVLLHCAAAYSRTSAAGALYAMRRTGARPADAVAAMGRALPGAGPAGAFRAALERASPHPFR